MVAARIALLLTAALAFPRTAAAGPCDALVAAIVRSTGAEFLRSSPSGKTAFLAHPHVDSFAVDCSTPSRPLVSAYRSRDAFPPAEFFTAVAAAGALVASEEAGRVEAGLRRCRRAALARPAREMSGAAIGAARIECDSFTRDGGSVGVSISGRQGRPEAR